MKLVTCDVNYLDGYEVYHRKTEDLKSTPKLTVVDTYADKFEKSLFKLNFHLLDHLGENVRRLGSEKYLDDSSFEHVNVAIKRYLRSYSMTKATMMQETVKNGKCIEEGRHRIRT